MFRDYWQKTGVLRSQKQGPLRVMGGSDECRCIGTNLGTQDQW